MNCPDCNGPMWDNRETKKNPKQPDYKCKNKACDKAVWLKPKESGANDSGAARSTNGAVGPRASRPLGPLYFSCMKIAAATVKQHIGDKATAQDIIAATATLFIGATNTGAPLTTPKAKPAPPPPPPPAAEEPGYDDDYDNPDNLPF